MQEVKSLKNEVNELKRGMEFPQNDLEHLKKIVSVKLIHIR